MRILLVILALFMAGCNRDIESDLLKEVGPSVVEIVSPSNSSTGGTGFAIRGRNNVPYLLTNGHVCEVGHDGWVAVIDGDKNRYLRRILKVSGVTDLCLIEGVDTLKTLPFGEFSDPKQTIYSVGYPKLIGLVLASGHHIKNEIVQLASNSKTCEGPKHLRGIIMTLFGPMELCIMTIDSQITSLVIYPGNSGSPVVNSDGEVIGVVFAGDSATNYGLMVPVRNVLDFLQTGR